MSNMIIKIVDANSPEKIAQAIGEIKAAGFPIILHEEASFLGVDANKHSGGEQAYGPCHVIVGKSV